MTNPPSPPTPHKKVTSHIKVSGLHSAGASYKTKVPPRATPTMAMKTVTNGNCSMGAMALEDLEVEVEADEPGDDEPEVDSGRGNGSA